MVVTRWTLGLAVASVTTSAWADEPASKVPTPTTPTPVPAEAAAAPERRSYGLQTLALDGMSATLFLTGVAISESTGNEPRQYNSTGNCVANCPEDETKAGDTLAVMGVVGYGLGAPIVHLAHDHPGKAAASAGLRAASAFLSLIGVVMCQQRFCDYMVPGALSVGAVVLLDATTIAKEDVPRPAVTWSVSPWIDARTRVTGIGVGGAF